MRQATRAFNDMQTRIVRLVEGRTRMLAAVSHDLRTPLTLLRLRAENLPEGEERGKILATIGEMSGMIGSVLDFARNDISLENRRRTDLTALLESIVDDMKDAEIPVTMQPSATVIYNCYGASLKRAITNLIDNAVKYGRTARVAVCETPTLVKITVEDEGPGIPEHELGRVMEPFYRVEDSRSRETGGTGLGLAIAVSVIEAHGGELKLANRREGGLRAEVWLPR
jgi:signal transduction histidine kinase